MVVIYRHKRTRTDKITKTMKKQLENKPYRASENMKAKTFSFSLNAVYIT